MSSTVLVDTSTLQVGDLWPQKMAQRYGPIVAIKPYDGDPDVAAEAGITGIVEFADGSEISIGSVIPAPAEVVAHTQAHRAHRSTQ